MQDDIQKKIEDMETKIDKIYVSVEKTRRYFFWTFVLTVAFFILPLIGLVFALPSFLNYYQNIANVAGITN